MRRFLLATTALVAPFCAAAHEQTAWLHGSAAAGACSVPGGITDLAIASRGSTTLGVTFTTPSGSPTSFEWRNAGGAASAGPSSGTISNAVAGTDYPTLQIRGNNACGSGGWSNSVYAYTYPVDVVTNSLQGVWDLGTSRISAAGIQNAPNKTLPANSASLPSQCTFSSGTPNLVSCTGTGTFSLSQWDFTNAEVDINCSSCTVTISDSKFATSVGQAFFLLCGDSGSPTLTIQTSEYVGTGRNAGFESGWQPRGSCTATFQTSYLHDEPLDYVTRSSTVAFTFQNNYMRAPGRTAVGPTTHGENLHIRGSGSAAVTLNRNLVNLEDATGSGPWWSAVYFFEPSNSTGLSNVTFNENIVKGMSFTNNGAYTFFIRSNNAGSSGPVSNANASNNVAEPGSSAVFGKNGGADPSNYGTCTGNLNFSGAAATCP